MMNPDSMAELQNATGPIERLTWHYENPEAEAISRANSDMPVVGITSNTVPWELIRAAGAFPYVIHSGNSNHADIGPSTGRSRCGSSWRATTVRKATPSKRS